MAATPQYGAAIFYGLRSKVTYVKDIYLSDVAAALLRWDAGSGASATSETSWTPPEAVVLVDLAIRTGTADTKKIQLTRNGVPTGDMIRYAPHTDTIATRPRLNIPFRAGDKVAGIQVSD